MKRLILLLVLLMTVVAESRTAYLPVIYPDSVGLDSVEVDLYRDADFTNIYDSIRDSIKTFPFSGLLTIDDKKQWHIEWKEYYHRSNFPIKWRETVWGSAGVPTATPPVGAGLCTVHGYVSDNQGNAVIGAVISFVLDKNKVVDTCNNATILPFPYRLETNDTGYFSIELLQSSCVGNTAYKVKISIENEYGTIERNEETLIIPSDSTTYFLKY